jgi:hypothetical protein
MSENDKTFRGNASQFYIAGELCRPGYSAVVTLGNIPNVDILGDLVRHNILLRTVNVDCQTDGRTVVLRRTWTLEKSGSPRDHSVEVDGNGGGVIFRKSFIG